MRILDYRHGPIFALLALCLEVSLSLQGSPARAQPIGTRHNTDLDFSQFESYAWSAPRTQEHARAADDPLLRNSPLDVSVRAAIESALTQRGLIRKDREPDLLLSYVAVLGDRVETPEARSNVPGSAEDLAGLPPTRQGTIVITLQLPDGTFAWSGVGRQKGQSLQNNEELIKRTSKLATRITSRYPPGHSRP